MIVAMSLEHVVSSGTRAISWMAGHHDRSDPEHFPSICLAAEDGPPAAWLDLKPAAGEVPGAASAGEIESRPCPQSIGAKMKETGQCAVCCVVFSVLTDRVGMQWDG